VVANENPRGDEYMGMETSNMIELGKIGELADGEMKEVTVNGKPFLVARIKDKYYAANGRCPHMGGILSLGKLDGTIVTCPRHHSQFDLSDGHNIRWTDWTGLKSFVAKILMFFRIVRSPRPLKTYAVNVIDDRIMAEL
jgi:3-phenylpropionate/trans-cinnamate dioxygenase ferredoxin subunit